jgi:hypothetical protein
MQSVFLKQVAYNQRVIEAEDEIAGLNTEVADFLTEMSIDPKEQLVIGVNGSENVWSQSKGYFRRNKHWRAPKAANLPALPAPDSQKALHAPDSQLALPAPDHQKALPAPEVLKALTAPSKARNVAQEK